MDTTNRRDIAVTPGLSRRRFIGVAASTAGLAFSGATESNAAEPKLVMPPNSPPSRVVLSRSQYLTDGNVVHADLLGEMLDQLLRTLTRKGSAADAWHSILRPDDIIGLKFNQSGQAGIGTTSTMAGALISSLLEAGWKPRQIVCIEAPPDVRAKYGTALAKFGYTRASVDFGSGSDQLSTVLDQITALINVPFLKSHNIAGMTCALKNLSHGFVKHPARFHDNGCSPYIADIVALDAIRNKLRLSLVDAMRVVYDGGPEASGASIVDEGALLASSDPVAVDAVGLGLLNDIRTGNNLAKLARSAADLPYLAAAHRRGLGVALSHGIDVTRLGGA